MTVTAWASAPADQLRGTAGFGFWNHPFSPDVRRLPRLPRAIWFFFAAPPSNMALAYGVPGFGWKAATIDATRPGALALAPFGLPAILLMRRESLYAKLWRVIQRRLNIGEHLLANALLAVGFRNISGGRLAFVNFSRGQLLDRSWELFDPETVVIELVERVECNSETLAACREMASRAPNFCACACARPASACPEMPVGNPR